jgi:DNA-binding SARP family transcriptional activator
VERLGVSRQLLAEMLAQFDHLSDTNSGCGAIATELRDIISTGCGTPLIKARCFGSFRISGLDGWEAGPPPKRGRELIQYLILNPERVISRERLTEFFWPDLDVDAAQHRIHIAVSGARTFLRDVLGGFDAIRCTQGGYGWHPAVRVACDVTNFVDLYRAGSQQDMKSAITLYIGELLEGEGGEWLSPLRIRFSTMHASMLERLAGGAIAEGAFEDGLNYALELLALDRAHEGASRLVMQCFGAVGRRGQALAEYRSLHGFLRRHLGIEPSPETTAVIRSIVGESSTILARILANG